MASHRSFATWISFALAKKGWSYYQLAQRIGCTTEQVSRLTQGDTAWPRLDIALVIAAELAISLHRIDPPERPQRTPVKVRKKLRALNPGNTL